MRQFASFLLGALLGAILGSTIALLFAPSSGKTMQGEVVDTFDRVTGEVKRAAALRRHELESELSRLRQAKIKLE